jgi:hypothetical protein
MLFAAVHRSLLALNEHRGRAGECPLLEVADNGRFWPATVCRLLTHNGLQIRGDAILDLNLTEPNCRADLDGDTIFHR